MRALGESRSGAGKDKNGDSSHIVTRGDNGSKNQNGIRGEVVPRMRCRIQRTRP